MEKSIYIVGLVVLALLVFILVIALKQKNKYKLENPAGFENDSRTRRLGLAIGMAIGMLIGVGIGLAMDNPGVGIAIGAGTGVSFGVAIGFALKGNERESGKMSYNEYSRPRKAVALGIALALLCAGLIAYLILNK